MATTPEQATKPGGNWCQLLKDKVVIVTGAGGGIGSVIAETCVLHGARTVVADIRKQAVDEVMTKILNDNQSRKDYLMTLELDVTDEQSIENGIKTIINRWNTIDILVNNAAVFIFGPVENVSADDWTKILNVNVRGCALMAKAVVPYIKNQRSGSIIQMASMSGWIAQSEFVPYSTAKGALVQMTRNLALDLGPFDVRCNAICPGTTFTPATKLHAAHLKITVEDFIEGEAKKQCLKRLGTPQEIANLTVFLASDLCHFATGACFFIDGGYTTISKCLVFVIQN